MPGCAEGYNPDLPHKALSNFDVIAVNYAKDTFGQPFDDGEWRNWEPAPYAPVLSYAPGPSQVEESDSVESKPVHFKPRPELAPIRMSFPDVEVRERFDPEPILSVPETPKPKPALLIVSQDDLAKMAKCRGISEGAARKMLYKMTFGGVLGSHC